MEKITHDTLPDAVAGLFIKLRQLETLIRDQGSLQSEADQLLTVQEAADFLNLSVPTLYGKVQAQSIPVNKKGKRLYFSKQELTEWVKGGRKKTKSEIEADAEAQLISKKKGGAR